MYILLYGAVLSNIILLTKIKYKTILKPNVLLASMWCVCASISSLGLYGIYKPSGIVHFYSITVIIIFNTIYLLFNNIAKVNIDKANIYIKGKPKLKLIYISNIICWLFLSRIAIKSIAIIAMGGFKLLRTYAFDGLASTLELTLVQWLVTPVFEATVIIAIIYTITKKKAKCLKIIAIVDIIFNVTVFGGRYFIVKALVYYIIAFIIIKSNNIDNLIKIKINKKIILISIIMLSSLTMMRSWNGTSIIKETYLYFTSSFSFLDVLISDVSIGSEIDFMFGKGILGFIYNIILAPISIILGIPYTGSDYMLTQITAIPRLIGGGIRYNALGTMIYPLLLDLGYVGIVIGTTFLAISTSFIETMAVKNRSIIFIVLYIYFGNIIFSSVMNYYLIFPATGFTIIFLVLFTKTNCKIKTMRRKNE